MTDTSETSRPPRALLKQVALWTAMVAILAILFVRIPLDAVWIGFARVSIEVYLPLMLGLVAVTLLTDAVSYRIAINSVSTGQAIRLWTTLELRAASYVPSTLNYAAGQGTLAFLLQRRGYVTVVQAVSVVLLITGINGLVLCLLVGVGMLVGSLPADPVIRVVVIVMSATAPAYLLVVLVKPAFLRRVKAIEPILRAGVRGTLWMALARAAHVVLWLIGHFVVLRQFDVQIPIDEALMRIPLVFLIGAMPITPAGVGTAQAAAVALLSDFAPGDTTAAREGVVLAFSLSFQALSLSLQALLGLFFVRRISSR